MFETIVVGTDGSDHATLAGRHAFAIAELFDATVHVVAAVDVDREAGLFSAGGVQQAYVEHLETTATEGIDELLAVAPDGASIETATPRGAPARAVLSYAQAHGADLIAVGTRGRTGVSRVLTGSVAEAILRRAPIPVLTAHAENEPPAGYEELLVPTDGSDSALRAAKPAIALGIESAARLHAVNVIDLSGLAVAPDHGDTAGVIDELRAAGEDATDALVQRAREGGCGAITAVREGFPVSTLLEYAEEHAIDVVVMGTHGRTGLDRVLIGSTAERVIRKATLPVIAVPPAEKEWP